MLTAVVLAGGLGTRLRPVVEDVPKPMAPIRGRPFLEYQLDYWVAQGVGRFILSVGFLHDLIQEHFGSSYEGVPIVYSVEDSPLDTGGALLLAASRLVDAKPFLVLNGDTYFNVSLKTLIGFSARTKSHWCLSLFPTEEVGRYTAVDLAEDGRIRSFSSTDSNRRLANGGVYLVQSRALQELPYSAGQRVSLEKEIFPAALAVGQRFYGVEFHGTFLDIGLPTDYHRAGEVLGGQEAKLSPTARSRGI